MQFAERYIQSAEKIINRYDGSIPLHHFIKQFFAADKKYGSKDRKAITHACYCYYRLGRSLMEITITEKIKAGIFLCNDEPVNWKNLYNEHWLKHWSINIEERITFLTSVHSFHLQEIFSLQNEISNEIDKDAFMKAHLVQPDLFLRIRPGREVKVLQQLSSVNIPFHQVNNNCVALPNATNINELLSLNKDVVVQDFSSQKVAALLSTIHCHLPTLQVWDCCAASGGKSILTYDTLKNIDLTVSDVRSSIINNLKKRFTEAGINNYKSFVADLTVNYQPSASYDLIICDAPCSGSGTWSRTPEQLMYFDADKIDYYTSLQKRIALNVIPALKKEAYFLYITCSVFKKENEDVVEYIKANSSLQLQTMQYLKGYDQKADTMFAALFTSAL